MEPFQIYPAELSQKENEAIRERRKVSRLPLESTRSQGLPTDTIGLALSGGGVRSATFNLGILQALAKNKLLRRIDLLSTISGGGYIGSFLGRFFDRLRGSPVLPADLVEGALTDPQSPEIKWLRRHGDYIAPAGQSDFNVNLALFFRNFLTLHLVIGLLLLAGFGLATFARYFVLERASALFPYLGGLNWTNMPLGHLVESGLGAFWSPWFMLFELLLLFFALPQAIAYWLISPKSVERYNWTTLTAAVLAFSALLWLGVRDGLNVAALLGAVPFLAAFVMVEYAWLRVRRQNRAVGTGGPSVERLRARSYLTRDLGLWLAICSGVLGFALIDTGAHAIYEAYLRQNHAYIKALAQLGAMLAALLPVLQFLARFVSHRQSTRENPTSLTRWLSKPAVSGVLASLLLAPPLLIISLMSHIAFDGGSEFRFGLALVGSALVLSALFAFPAAVPFINRSSLNAAYAARIASAYLGASNPLRFASRGGTGRDIDEVMPNDDTTNLQSYRPDKAGGPLHLIGMCVNETVDQLTQREARDRQGSIMAVSPFGMSIGRYWHALWRRDEAEKPDGFIGVEMAGYISGTPHPLLDIAGKSPRVEDLHLRNWISISGAAFGSGMGQLTNRALSFLLTLGNLRTGYWWDSGLSSADRGMRPNVSFLRKVLWLLPRAFVTQSRLLDEALARFSGPWSRYWYLSDGGHFENLGVYELVRRRIPIIVVVDAGADPDYDFDDFANLQRKLRIDFQADLRLFSDADWNLALKAYLKRRTDEGANPAALMQAEKDWLAGFSFIREQLAAEGPHGEAFADLTPVRDADENVVAPAKKCAALFKVQYSGAETLSLLLYIKATLLGDESVDVKNYNHENPDFPHQSTADQFFDEAQWESYRCLGEHLGGKILVSGPAKDCLWLSLLRSDVK